MLKMNASDLSAIRLHAEQTYPRECCGVLLGQFDGDVRHVTAVIPCANAHADSPQNRYSIDPRALIRIQREARERGDDIVGFYHSHPDHPPAPSPTDLAEAHWFGCSYVIISVAHGNATATNSFELAGTEDDKKFQHQTIDLI
jgi:proteasome lid subunit RPN8/RPN11